MLLLIVQTVPAMAVQVLVEEGIGEGEEVDGLLLGIVLCWGWGVIEQLLIGHSRRGKTFWGIFEDFSEKFQFVARRFLVGHIGDYILP